MTFFALITLAVKIILEHIIAVQRKSKEVKIS
jgi:hypothetical protein